MTDAPADPTAPRAARGLLALALGTAFLARAVPGATVEALRAGLWLTDQALGTLVSAFAGPFALALPVGAWLARGGRRRLRILGAGLLVCGAATALATLARGFWPLVLARCAAGAAAGVGAGATAGLLVALDRVRGRALPGLAPSAGGVALAYLVGGLAARGPAWQAAFWAAGGAIMVLGAFCWAAGDPPRRGPDPWPEPSVRELTAAARRILGDRPRLLSLLAAVTGAAAVSAFLFWIPAFLVRTRNVPRRWAGAELAAAVLVSALVGAALARAALQARRGLSERPGGPAFVAALGAGGAALALAVALPWPEPAIFLPALMVGLLGTAAATYGGLASVRGRGPVDPAVLGVAILAVHGLGELSGAFALGALADRITFGRALYLVPGMFLASGVLWAAAGWARDARAGSSDEAPGREMASP